MGVFVRTLPVTVGVKYYLVFKPEQTGFMCHSKHYYNPRFYLMDNSGIYWAHICVIIMRRNNNFSWVIRFIIAWVVLFKQIHRFNPCHDAIHLPCVLSKTYGIY